MREPLVSVIIPIYNVEQYLERCLNSVIHQTYKHLEIILIDDGSPDKCGEICNTFSKKDKRIVVIHKKNGGLSDARNVGLDKATGEFITFIDSDDFVSTIYIEKLLNLCIKYKADIAQCDFESGKNNFFGKEKKESVNAFFKDSVFRTRDIKIIACAKLYKNWTLKKIRFPIGRINEDEFFTYKPLYQANKVVITNLALYYYFQSDNSIMREKRTNYPLDFIDAYYERMEYFDRFSDEENKELTRKELLIRLMLLFSKCLKDENNENNIESIDTLFKKEYKILRKNVIKKKERVLLYLFFYFPNISSKIINRFN